MEKQIIELTKEKFKEINTNEKLRNAVAFAHSCLNENMEFKYKKALMYPISYKVTEEQIKIAINLRLDKQKEVLKENKNNLLFVGMGMEFKPFIKDGIGNHRIRTTFLNNDGIKCFIEVGTGKEGFLRIDHAIFNYKPSENNYNYKDLEHKTPELKYTYKNILKIVNAYFNCNFKKCIVDYYNINPDGIICESPKLKGFWGENGLSKEIDKRDYQNIEGLKVEITKKEYWHFLECLPPLDFNGQDFYLQEFLTGDLTLYFTIKEKKYYCEVKKYKGNNRD